jgi:hypothetical protein
MLVEAVSPLAPACASFDWFTDHAERTLVQGGGRKTVTGLTTEDRRLTPSREQSSAGLLRVGAYRWERRLTPVCEGGGLLHESADDR